MKIKKILATALLLLGPMMLFAQSVKQVDSKAVLEMLQKSGKWTILDVRTAEEYNQGHIRGAINIDIRRADALERIDSLDRKANYIVHCRTNHRSTTAVEQMTAKGFKTIYQMTDGMNGWILNKFPTVKNETRKP